MHPEPSALQSMNFLMCQKEQKKKGRPKNGYYNAEHWLKIKVRNIRHAWITKKGQSFP